MRRPRLALAALPALALSLFLAAPAFAADNGEGLLGETDDKIVTFVSLGVLLFFTLIVFVGSWAQAALDRRKQARKAGMGQRTGW